MGATNRTRLWTVVALVMIVVLAIIVVGCGGGSDEKVESSVTGTAAERAKTILGHEPTGLAKKIVESGTMTVANDANYEPCSYLDPKTNEIIGFDVDVANKVGQILGLKIKFVQPPWESVPAGLTAGRFDVSIGSMTATAERAKYLAFTKPYYYASGQLFMKKGGTVVNDVSQLAGKKVGVGANTTHYTFLKKESDAVVKTYATDLEAFPDLVNGNLDYILTAGPTGQQAIVDGKPFAFSGKPLYYEDLCFAAKLGEDDLVTLLDYTVKEMHNDGSLSTMSQKWFNGIDLTVK